MTELEAKVRRLFDEYGRTSNDALKDDAMVHVSQIASFFAAYFVGSTPKAVFGGPNDAAFREFIPRGFARYREAGGRRMEITGVKVVTLNELHALAEVGWDFCYVNKAGKGGNVRFTNFYFVTVADSEPRIFAYITGDEEKAMKDHGLA
ncbi:hypothetical protein [Rhizobium terrae]|uniref:hypothetical protein n=1 Tax=Rhizobium terrae TaxID=2171756 RepID=UPI0013C3794C|nr:hypothetical protein [Rhizobium terrae]